MKQKEKEKPPTLSLNFQWKCFFGFSDGSEERRKMNQKEKEEELKKTDERLALQMVTPA